MKTGNLLKKILSGVLFIIMVSGLAGCGQADKDSSAVNSNPNQKTEQETGGTDLKEFRIGVGGRDNAPTMEIANLAYNKGYLEEELNKAGYTVKIIPFLSAGPEINEALAGGQLEAAIYGDFPAFTSKSNGIDTTVVASVNGRQQFAVLSGNDEVRTAKDLEGHKVVFPQGTVTQYFWEHYAQARGIDTSKVELINAASDAMSLLQSGDADAYIMTANVLYYMESQGIGRVIDTGSDLEDGSTSYIFTVVTKVLNENPEVGTAINKSLIRAWNDAVKDPELLYEAVSSESLPVEFAKKSYEFDTSLEYMSPEIKEEKLSYYENLVKWLTEHSIISEEVDVKSFIDTSYYQKAVSEINKE